MKIPYNSVFGPEVRGMMVAAVLASMKVVKRHQCHRFTDVLGTKADGTLSAMPADKESDKAGKDVLRKIPSVIVHGEESGAVGTGMVRLYLDGLDGSMPYAVGASTSTVIAAAYSETNREVFFCLVGEPQSWRIWQASLGVPTTVAVFPADGNEPTEMSPVRVSGGGLDFKSRVMIDSYPSFRQGREGRVILSTSELNILHAKIQERTGLLMLGSNGIHHALVANGGKGAIGAITTAIGGPWDVCPVLLVLQAGGAARAWSVLPNGTLAEKNPLSVCDYDIVATGNTQATVDLLSTCIEQAKKQ